MKQRLFAKLFTIAAFALELTAAPLIQFSGTSYVNVGTPGKLQFADNTPLTVEGWVKFSSVAGTQMIYSKNNSRTAPYTHMFGVMNGGTQMSAYTGGAWVNVNTPSPLLIGRWYHLAYSFDGTNISFYLDGALLDTKPFSYTYKAGHKIQIGGYDNSSGPQGNIMDLRVWNCARGQDEVQATMNHRLSGVEPSLLACWPLDEGQTATVRDIAPHGSDAAIVGATWTTGAPPPQEPDPQRLHVSGDTGLFGTVVPAYGATNVLAHGDTFTCSASGGIQYDTRDSRYRATCAGYDIYTNTATPPLGSGNTTSFSYTHNTNLPLSLLVWRWAAQYEIESQAGTNGQVSTAGGWYNKESTVTVTALPDTGYAFSHWTGDFPENALRDGATLSFKATYPVAVTAVFGNLLHVSTNGNDSSDGKSWATAKQTIQAAVDAALENDTVIVSNGTYTSTSTGFIVTIAKKIYLRSVNGPDVTIIDPLVGKTSTARHCISLTAAAAGAEVDGFTLQGVYNMGTETSNCALNLQNGVVKNCIIRNNTVYGGVGGAWVGTNGHLVDCVVSNNACSEWQNGLGGGVYLGSANAVVERCLISGNVSRSSMGAAGVYLTAGTLRNCLLTENRAIYFEASYDQTRWVGQGSGIRVTGGRALNCTVSGNFALYKGGGILQSGGTVSNTIAWGNRSSYRMPQSDWDLVTTAGVAGNNCFPAATNSGDIALEPRFVSPESGDYRLQPGSPCIDAATRLSGFSDDFNGDARPGGASWDIGALEMDDYETGALACGFTAPVIESLNSLAVSFTPAVAGANTNITWHCWLFGDGHSSQGAGLQSATHTYTSGCYNVTLVVSNSANEEAILTRTRLIRIYPENLYVDLTGSHTFPFDSTAKAATNIADAIAAAPGIYKSTVWLADGTWAPAATSLSTYESAVAAIVLEKPVTLRSVHGVTNCIISQPGGKRSLFLYHPEATVADITVTASSASGAYASGMGAYMYQGVLTNCVFHSIYAGGWGGAICMTGGKVLDCHIYNNRANEWQLGYGGGIYIENYSSYGVPLVDRCRIERNQSWGTKGGGGGIYMKAGVIRNSLIYANTNSYYVASGGTAGSGYGGGVRMTGGLLENCTITGNYATDAGGGVNIASGPAYITNCIVYGNASRDAPANDVNIYNSGGFIGYTCAEPMPSGTGNMALDPKFENSAASDFRLKPGSPCIDQGLNAPWMDAAHDLEKASRLVNGTVDIGCHEAPDPWDGPLVANFVADHITGFVSRQIVFTAKPVGANTNIIWYNWDFGNSVTKSGANLAVVTNSYTAGYYDVSLEMRNDYDERDTSSRAGYIRIAPAITHVSTNGASIPPYMTWAAAARSVQEAMTAIGYGDNGAHTIVAVTSGVYTSASEIGINNLATIQGVGPAADVVFTVSANRVFNLDFPEATLSGITIAGGRNGAADFQGAGVLLKNGTITNCIIRDNLAGGLGGGVRQYNGLIVDSVFTNNLAEEWNYGYGGGVYISGGSIDRCVFVDNKVRGNAGGAVYMENGNVRNCLMYTNSVVRTAKNYNVGAGVALYGGILESCTIVTNWALLNGGGIYQSGGIVSNCIVYGNFVTDSGAPDWYNPLATTRYSCSPALSGLLTGTGNIIDEPRFVNPAAFDFRLRQDSPCVDTGMNTPWMANGLDLARRPRLAIGRWPRVAPPQTADMGCFETHAAMPGSLIMLK